MKVKIEGIKRPFEFYQPVSCLLVPDPTQMRYSDIITTKLSSTHYRGRKDLHRWITLFNACLLGVHFFTGDYQTIFDL